MCANDLHLTEQSIPAEPSCETYNGNKWPPPFPSPPLPLPFSHSIFLSMPPYFLWAEETHQVLSQLLDTQPHTITITMVLSINIF